MLEDATGQTGLNLAMVTMLYPAPFGDALLPDQPLWKMEKGKKKSFKTHFVTPFDPSLKTKKKKTSGSQELKYKKY
jgi:hypothetical protein